LFGELEFYAAFDAVLGELAEEIAWRYEGGDIIGYSENRVESDNLSSIC